MALKSISTAINLLSFSMRKTFGPGSFIDISSVLILKLTIPLSIKIIHFSSIIAIISKNIHTENRFIIFYYPLENLFIWKIKHDVSIQRICFLSPTPNTHCLICLLHSYCPSLTRANHNLLISNAQKVLLSFS